MSNVPQTLPVHTNQRLLEARRAIKDRLVHLDYIYKTSEEPEMRQRLLRVVVELGNDICDLVERIACEDPAMGKRVGSESEAWPLKVDPRSMLGEWVVGRVSELNLGKNVHVPYDLCSSKKYVKPRARIAQSLLTVLHQAACFNGHRQNVKREVGYWKDAPSGSEKDRLARRVKKFKEFRKEVWSNFSDSLERLATLLVVTNPYTARMKYAQATQTRDIGVFSAENAVIWTSSAIGILMVFTREKPTHNKVLREGVAAGKQQISKRTGRPTKKSESAMLFALKEAIKVIAPNDPRHLEKMDLLYNPTKRSLKPAEIVGD